MRTESAGKAGNRKPTYIEMDIGELEAFLARLVKTAGSAKDAAARLVSLCFIGTASAPRILAAYLEEGAARLNEKLRFSVDFPPDAISFGSIERNKIGAEVVGGNAGINLYAYFAQVAETVFRILFNGSGGIASLILTTPKGRESRVWIGVHGRYEEVRVHGVPARMVRLNPANSLAYAAKGTKKLAVAETANPSLLVNGGGGWQKSAPVVAETAIASLSRVSGGVLTVSGYSGHQVDINISNMTPANPNGFTVIGTREMDGVLLCTFGFDPTSGLLVHEDGQHDKPHSVGIELVPKGEYGITQARA